MDQEFRQRVIDALQRSEELPAEWARELFPSEKREYELVYHGKEREEEILADTMAVPLQPVRTFGTNGDDWHNKLIFGDNLQAMKTLLAMKERGELFNADSMPGVRLVYIDPPFATRQEFRGSQDQKAYQDKLVGAEFLEFLRKRLVLLREVLSENGTLYLHLDQKKVCEVKQIADEVFGDSRFRNHIVWYYTNKIPDSRKFVFTVSTDHILTYGKTRDVIFHTLTTKRDKPIKVSRFSKVDGEKVYDKDADGKGIYIERRVRMMDNVWQIALLHCQPEVTGFPTQKPEELVRRAIEASSNEGDIVLDAFAGSGTTCAVAERLGRRWIGIDCGKLAIYTIQKRMLNLKAEIGNKGKALKPKPFTLYNAGLYDFSKLKQLPWADWRFFALQLFGCKDEPHMIGGLQLDGKRQGYSVLVFNHVEQEGKRIDEDTVAEIHAAVGKKIGGRFFIIAPRGVFDFQQDYIDLGGVRYYALRIPYSIINELHRREFTALQQPNDENAVNDTVDAVGFDFIQPPEVDFSVSVKKDKGGLFNEAWLKIKKFRTHARLRGKDTVGGLEAFSMLMLDFDYNGDVFDLDAVFYANQMQAEGWQARFSVESLGEKVMAVFIDIYGNELQTVIPREAFGIRPRRNGASARKAQV